MQASGQLSFSDIEYAGKKKKTRRELFLTRRDALLPCPQMVALIAPTIHPASCEANSPGI
ncbi:hypothetical protein [Chitinivorax sp. B]|uniref:hypothetical protein n=1 Tax=Chitinivorax sp. B TaxID=2502235 RepID=UPI0010F600E1|nr:hypothetical protein [Chitinivorax sp. B]